MSLNPQQRQQLHRWLHLLREDHLPDDDARQLEQLVLADEEARRVYVQATGLCASLHWMNSQEKLPAEVLASESANDLREDFARDLNRAENSKRKVAEVGTLRLRMRTAAAYLSRPTPFSMTVAAVAMLFLISLSALIAVPMYRRNAPVAEGSGLRPVVARLTGIHNAEWADHQVATHRGAYLLAGHDIDLKAGYVEVTFHSGAKVILEGPTTFRVSGQNTAHLDQGQLSANIPARAIGFTIHTPAAIAKDLGTEFGVRVTDSGQTDISVYLGRVEVGLSAGHPQTAAVTPKIVTAGQTVRLNAGGSTIAQPLSGAHVEVRRKLPAGPHELRISKEYVQAVLAAGPKAYWRFDHIEGGIIRNQVGGDGDADRYTLRNIGGVQFRDVGEGNLAATFRADDQLRYLLCDDMDVLAGEEYTVEAWVQPIQPDGSQVIATLGRGTTGDSLLLSLTSTANTSRTIRFLHRSPPGRSGGVDLFSESSFQLGRWHHIVAVSGAGKLQLYLNGKLVGEGERGAPLAASATNLILGRLDTSATSGARQFAGRLDEIAIYDHALADSTITQHYELGQGAL